MQEWQEAEHEYLQHVPFQSNPHKFARLNPHRCALARYRSATAWVLALSRYDDSAHDFEEVVEGERNARLRPWAVETRLKHVQQDACLSCV
jgi:hypothetical protein